jgi:hypothetical protein
MNKFPIFEPTLLDELVQSDDCMEFSEAEFVYFMNLDRKRTDGILN